MQLSGGVSERRHSPRDVQTEEPSRLYVVQLILGTYKEMPGLILHLNQAARLFGLRASTCQIVLDDLVKQGHLRRAADGQYLAT